MKLKIPSEETVLWMMIFSSLFFLLAVYIALVIQLQSRYNEQKEWNNLEEDQVTIIQHDQNEDPQNEETKEAKSIVCKVTHYCGCSKCCGKWSDGSEDIAYGSTGKLLTPFVSIAVDPNVIPYGTILYDNEGNEYIAEDCGGAIKGNRIDLFVGNHKEALKLGVVKEKTFYWEEN